MNKRELIVPKGVRYINEWVDYNLNDFGFPHILNKVLTGCGFTEYCIRNKQDLVLVSPRKFLLENKEDQHEDEVYYAKNNIYDSIDFEKDLSKTKPPKERTEVTEEKRKLIEEAVLKFKEDIKQYIQLCTFSGKPFKILVTYDSFRHVKEVLEEKNIVSNTQIVVDEFQSIFIDSRFKSDTEMELLYHLRNLDKVCFVSATPMLDEYLDRLDEFKNLPYLELNWKAEDPGRVKKPGLDIKFTQRSLNEEIGKVIQTYQKGKFETKLLISSDGTPNKIESREAVFFMNSVKGICQAIRSNKLHLEDCNILCAKTDDNLNTVRKAFNEVLRKEHQEKVDDGLIDKRERIGLIKPTVEVIGKIPKRGERHKMFTFCTRTVYLGADFYSTNARTFVFSDSNIECLSVDISMDLEQILGRQRLDENPWKNTAIMFVKTTGENNKRSKEEFNQYIDDKVKKTESLLRTYDVAFDNDKFDVADTYKKLASVYHYRDDYVAVNEHSGSSLLPVFNNLVLVSEQRAFDVQQVDYKDRFSVFNALESEELKDVRKEIKDFAAIFNDLKDSRLKLKNLVEFGELEEITEEDMKCLLQLIPPKYGDYYMLLGPNKIKNLSYQEADLKKEWERQCTDYSLREKVGPAVYNMFEVGKRYTNKDIKQALKNLYAVLGYSKTAKATDLGEFFYIKDVLTSDKKHGLEIIAKK